MVMVGHGDSRDAECRKKRDAWHISFFPPKPEWARQNPTQEEHYFIPHTDAHVCRNWYMKDLQVVCLSPADSRNTQLLTPNNQRQRRCRCCRCRCRCQCQCHGHAMVMVNHDDVDGISSSFRHPIRCFSRLSIWPPGCLYLLWPSWPWATTAIGNRSIIGIGHCQCAMTP